MTHTDDDDARSGAEHPAGGGHGRVDVTQLTELKPFQRLASQRMLPAARLLTDNNENNGNVEAWERWAINPRALIDVSHVDARTTVLGREISLPVIVAPFALQRLCHPDAEVATAHGATRAQTIMALSVATTRSPADVGAAAPGFWMHLQFLADRELMADVLAEGMAAGASALCLTVDLPITPWWPDQFRRALHDVAAESAATGRVGHFSERFATARAKTQTTEVELSWDDRPVGSSATWADLGWLRDVCPVPLVLKGILTPHDARLAVEHGADAIIVSNHGGHSLRQSRPWTIARHSSRVGANGFSQTTWMPRFKAASAGATWSAVGVAMITTSGFTLSNIAS